MNQLRLLLIPVEIPHAQPVTGVTLEMNSLANIQSIHALQVPNPLVLLEILIRPAPAMLVPKAITAVVEIPLRPLVLRVTIAPLALNLLLSILALKARITIKLARLIKTPAQGAVMETIAHLELMFSIHAHQATIVDKMLVLLTLLLAQLVSIKLSKVRLVAIHA